MPWRKSMGLKGVNGSISNFEQVVTALKVFRPY